LNQGLSQYNLTINQDTDTPYANVIGFLIPIADIKLLIKNAIGGGAQAEPTPEATPAPEEPMKEIKRMQKLAGVIKETLLKEDIIDDIEDDLLQGDFEDKQGQIEYLQYVIEYCQERIARLQRQIDAGETFDS
jgi:hypothetical protein